MSAPTARQFTYDALPGRVVFGAGASRRLLAAEVDRLGASRLLLIATEQERPLAQELSAVLGDRVVGVFTDVQPMRPAHVHFIVEAPPCQRLSTHVFADGDRWLDSDAVFGVRSNLITGFERREAGAAPDGRDIQTPTGR
jgi:intradiol ring-cleaving dioxygenase-like protein